MQADELFEMSNIRKSASGLPVNIYASGGSVNHQHGPRIKIMTSSADKFNPHETVSVLLKRNITANDIIGYHSLPTQIISDVREFINLNYEVLLAHWNDELDSGEMYSKLQSITRK